MIFTEQNAPTKWCPFSRLSSAAGPHNRPVNSGSMCMGSTCAAWRWFDGNERRRIFATADTRATQEPARPENVPPSWVWVPYDPESPGNALWREDDASFDQRRRGYCGLAGDL